MTRIKRIPRVAHCEVAIGHLVLWRARSYRVDSEGQVGNDRGDNQPQR